MSHLYAIRSGRFIKIGKTSGAVERRMKQLSIGNPEPLTLIESVSIHSAIVGSAEARLHKALRESHHVGEWFSLSDGEASRLLHEAKAWSEAQQAPSVRVIFLRKPTPQEALNMKLDRLERMRRSASLPAREVRP